MPSAAYTVRKWRVREPQAGPLAFVTIGCLYALMTFWIFLSIMTALAALSVLVPLARGRSNETAVPSNADEAVYREQLAAIDRDLAQGLIDAEAAEAARTETARRLLAAHDRSGSQEHHGKASETRIRAVQLGAILLLPASALGIYLAIGAPDAEDQPLTARLEAPAENQSVEVLIARVERHLSQNPEDGEGWAIIAPVYMRVGNPQSAARAYANAIRLQGARPDWLTDMGEALTVANEGVITEPARAAFENAVELAPDAVKPRFFLAIALGQEGKEKEAITAWQDLLKDADSEAVWVHAAQQRLIELTGKKLPAPAKVKGPSEEDVAAAQQMNATDRLTMIKSMVQGLAARIDANGGTVAEWEQLMRAYVVLDEVGKASDVFRRAGEVFAKKPDDLARIKDAATELGLTGS